VLILRDRRLGLLLDSMVEEVYDGFTTRRNRFLVYARSSLTLYILLGYPLRSAVWKTGRMTDASLST
jgi:hypothetical protein